MAISVIEGRATVGVMVPEKYEFGTLTEEKMKVTEGEMNITLPVYEKKTYNGRSIFCCSCKH